MILREIDRILNHGAGKMKRWRALDILMQTTRSSKRTIQRVISNGMGTFWRDGKNGVLYFSGIDRVCRLMDIDSIRSKWFDIPIDHLFGKPSDVKSMIVCCVAARDERPVSIANLAERLGVSERIIQYYISSNVKKNGCFYKHKNLSILSIESNEKDATKVCGRLSDEGIHSEVMEWKDGRIAVCKRIPNTILSKFQRSNSDRIRYRLRGMSGKNDVSSHERLYAKGKERGCLHYSDSARNRSGTIFVKKGGRPVEIWSSEESPIENP